MSKKTYYEVVIEGHYNMVFGVLEGYLLGSKKDWNYWFSGDAGVEKETLTEIISEWFSIKTKIHHLIMEEDFWNDFHSELNRHPDKPKVNKKYIKSSKKIKSSTFDFQFRCYSQKYGEDIKFLIKSLPDNIILHNYNPQETIRDGAKGVEMYAPEHEYVLEGSGSIEGNIDDLIKMRNKFCENPLIETGYIKLQF